MEASAGARGALEFRPHAESLVASEDRPAPKSDISRRIHLTQIGTCLCSVMISMVLGALFDLYVLLLGGSNTVVGYVESANGMMVLLCALPIGCIADRYPKTRIYTLFGAFALAASVVIGVGYTRDWLPCLIVGSMLLSVCQHGNFTLSAPILSELTLQGEERTLQLSRNAMMQSLGAAFGPGVQMVFILITARSEWSLAELRPILCFGLACSIPFAVVSSMISSEQPRACRMTGELLEPGRQEADGCTADLAREGHMSGEAELSSQGRCVADSAAQQRRRWFGAILLEVSTFTTAVGSGMTFKFWGPFYKACYGLTPFEVCGMQMMMYLCIASTRLIFPWVSSVIGRPWCVLLSHYLAVICLFLISQGGPGTLILPLVLLRNALSNGNGPLMQAMVMDLVPGQHRGKWASIASLRRLSWSGSAFVGGLLSDSHDYRFAFFVTACVHCFSGLPVLLLSLMNISS